MPRKMRWRYMARYSYPQLYDPTAPRLGLPVNEFALMETYYDKAAEMVDFLADSEAVQSMQEINWTGKPQVDYMDHLPENKGIRGRILYSKDANGKQAYGGELIRQLKACAKANGIAVLAEHRATKIMRNSNAEVIGLEVRTKEEKTLYFRARKAVVFGSGGYTHNAELMLHFQRGPHFGRLCRADQYRGFYSNGRCDRGKTGEYGRRLQGRNHSRSGNIRFRT